VDILTQFILRLTFGLALGMALTDPRQVTSGYYRNHLYVLLGLNVLATMAAFSAPDRLALAPPLIAAVLCYAGSLAWLFERASAGIVLLAALSVVALWGAWTDTQWPASGDDARTLLAALTPVTSGLVLGMTIAAMFLGHWYLNSPTMAIRPLVRLVGLMAASIVLCSVVEAGNLALWLEHAGAATTEQWLFLAMRWLSGIFGALLLAFMAYRTLKIPNTQSATGILYVAVIVTFLGELVSLLWAAQSLSWT
jgi:hypothetical protein